MQLFLWQLLAKLVKCVINALFTYFASVVSIKQFKQSLSAIVCDFVATNVDCSTQKLRVINLVIVLVVQVVEDLFHLIISYIEITIFDPFCELFPVDVSRVVSI